MQFASIISRRCSCRLGSSAFITSTRPGRLTSYLSNIFRPLATCSAIQSVICVLPVPPGAAKVVRCLGRMSSTMNSIGGGGLANRSAAECALFSHPNMRLIFFSSSVGGRSSKLFTNSFSCTPT